MTHLAVFRSDITPPLGHPLCAGWYPPAAGVEHPLSALGVALLPSDALPIVLCVLDWAELSNEEHRLWRQTLAAAAGTEPDRVMVHCIHGHDTPWPDRGAQRMLDRHGHPGLIMDTAWCDRVLKETAAALTRAVPQARAVTAIRGGRARVAEVASNRRIIGPDGKSRGVRLTRCRNPLLREEPEGVIDPFLKTVSFWNGSEKLASLHFYAVHPTSYDGTGLVTPDFAGLARDEMTARESTPHLYFTECAGNVTAGKYNDGNPANRTIFCERLMAAMREAEATATAFPAETVRWESRSFHLPPRPDQDPAALLERISDPAASTKTLSRAALILAYQARCRSGIPLVSGILHLGPGIAILPLPGEAFIEYQLYAQSLRPDLLVAVPAYGDCGPGYITLERSFEEGGYEPTDSFCSGESEAVMKEVISGLLGLPVEETSV